MSISFKSVSALFLAAAAVLALAGAARAEESAPPAKKDAPPDAAKPDRPDPATLVGKPAPDFELELAAGGKVKLSELKDKSVVILDFWATWCPPCRKSLPVVAEVAKAYKEKGVAFYAVNQQEDEETIKGFQEKQKLQFTVALDPEGAIGEAYGVKGIPQTVIIGKDGTVQAVHVGALPDLKERLTKELDALLAGKKLVEDPKPENPLLPAGK